MDITAVNQKISSYYTATAGDYFSLLKPRVMSLVIFTALIGLIVAPGEIHPVIGFTAILCIAIAAGASGCLNMWYEADIDAKMERTAVRPIPSGADWCTVVSSFLGITCCKLIACYWSYC